MASLNVAVTMVFVHASLAPVGATESTVGGVRPRPPPFLSGSLHPLAIRSSRNNVVSQIALSLYLRMIIAFLFLTVN